MSEKEKLSDIITNLFGVNPSSVSIKDHRKRPEGQGKSSVSSYYNERHAFEVKKLLDEIEKSQNDGMVMYADFPHLSKNSLYLRINQGFRYLIDSMDFDPPNKYRSLRDFVKITRDKKGIRISIRKVGSDTPLTAQKVVPLEKSLEWKDRMEDFFESSKPGDRFEQDNLDLSDEEINDIKESCIQLTNFLLDITSDHIKILHISDDLQ